MSVAAAHSSVLLAVRTLLSVKVAVRVLSDNKSLSRSSALSSITQQLGKTKCFLQGNNITKITSSSSFFLIESNVVHSTVEGEGWSIVVCFLLHRWVNFLSWVNWLRRQRLRLRLQTKPNSS